MSRRCGSGSRDFGASATARARHLPWFVDFDNSGAAIVTATGSAFPVAVGENDTHQGAWRRYSRLKGNLSTVAARNTAHDGKAQPSSFSPGAQNPVERFEHQLALAFHHPDPGVFDFQSHLRQLSYAHGHATATRRVAQRIVQ